MVHGQTDINVREMEARRFGDWAVGRYGEAKALDEYHNMYQVHFPGEFREPGRPVKTTPIYGKLAARGAVFAETFGWERPKWFAAVGESERYSFRRTNWFAPVAAECKAVRERVGVLDLSSFAKFDVTGRDAAAFLDRVLANRVPQRNGRIVLAHALTDLGGIECEFTATRLDAERYYLLSAAVAQIHDRDWLMQHLREGEAVAVRDVTDAYAVLVVAGPRSRDVLAKLTDANLGNEAFPWLSASEIEVAGAPTRALRVSYVGELGWELHHPPAHMETLYDAVVSAGAEFSITDFGVYAVNALRMEKAYKAWGLELTTEITPVEAGLERFVKQGRPFIGSDRVAARARRRYRHAPGLSCRRCRRSRFTRQRTGLRGRAARRPHHQRRLRPYGRPKPCLRLCRARSRRGRRGARSRDTWPPPRRPGGPRSPIRSPEPEAARLTASTLATGAALRPLGYPRRAEGGLEIARTPSRD